MNKGFDYAGRQWRLIRARQLREEPFCRLCSDMGNVTPAVEVDHVTPVSVGGNRWTGPCQSLCHAHHSQKTRADMTAPIARAAVIERGAAVDGLPLDGRRWWNRRNK